MNSLSKFRHSLLAVVLATASSTTLFAQNLVQDPGFEASADGTGAHPFSASWTVNDPSAFSNVGGDSAFAHSGNNYANLGYDPSKAGPMPPAFASLSQTLATTIGTTYTLSFWLANNTSLPTNFFQAFFNGVMVSSTITSPPFPSNGTYQQIVLTGLVATSTSTSLQFRYRNDDDFWNLDDVSVTGPAAAPEGGATLWILLPVFGGVCLLHRRLRVARQVG